MCVCQRKMKDRADGTREKVPITVDGIRTVVYLWDAPIVLLCVCVCVCVCVWGGGGVRVCACVCVYRYGGCVHM